jgi:nucleotide-binding universal stress UspA family protein
MMQERATRIAVGIDFSPPSNEAARQALAIARHRGAELMLLHAGTTVELPSLDFQANASTQAAFEVYRRRLADELARDRERLAELRERLSGQGVVVSTMVAEGFPDEALCSAAAELDVDLLVVGTHGRTGLNWFLLGSVAQRVVRMCERDVLVSRSRPPFGPGGARRVLCATDFSPSAERALDRAIELCAPDGAIDVLHFYHLAPAIGWTEGSFGFAPELERSLVGQLTADGERLVAPRRRAGGPAIRFEVLPGPPIPSTVHRLETESYDLVTLGSHGRRGFRRAILGSVAEAVVRRAPCSVLVARHRPT